MAHTVLRFVLLALLFAGAERGLDLVSDHTLHDHEHGDRSAQHDAIGDLPDESEIPESPTDCDHCLHGHLAGFVSDALATRSTMRGEVAPAPVLPPKLLGRAPPTPPPNA